MPREYETLSTSSTHGSSLKAFASRSGRTSSCESVPVSRSSVHLPQKLLLAAAIPGRKHFGQLNLVKRKLVLRLVMQPIHSSIR